jgi:hypothetical protein
MTFADDPMTQLPKDSMDPTPDFCPGSVNRRYPKLEDHSDHSLFFQTPQCEAYDWPNAQPESEKKVRL